MWWELGSLGELTVLEAEGGTLVASTQLAHVQHVGRTRGPEYYELCIDIDVEGPGDAEERTITLRPPGRAAMEAWLRALTEQVEIHRERGGVEGGGSPGEGGSLTVQLSGWMQLTRRDLQHSVGRKWVQLVTAQSAAAEETLVMHTLYWFDREVDSVDLGTGSSLDLAEIEEIDEVGPEAAHGRGLLLTTEAGWLLALVPEEAQQLVVWRNLLAATCVNAEGYGDLAQADIDLAQADRAATIARSCLRQHGAGGVASSGPALQDRLRMAVAVGSGSVMLPFECMLSGAGELTFELDAAAVTEDMPEEALRGAIDVKVAIGIWLIGQPGWRKLDVIVLGRKYTFAAEHEPTLERWHQAIAQRMPHHPVEALCKGWLSKRADMGGGWKDRYFVMLSTRELLYYENETSQKRKGSLDLKTRTLPLPLPLRPTLCLTL